MNKPWTITLGDGRVFTREEWTELSKEDRQNLLIKSNPIARFKYTQDTPNLG